MGEITDKLRARLDEMGVRHTDEGLVTNIWPTGNPYEGLSFEEENGALFCCDDLSVDQAIAAAMVPAGLERTYDSRVMDVPLVMRTRGASRVRYHHPKDACIELLTDEQVTIRPYETLSVGTGLSVRIPNGFYGMLSKTVDDLVRMDVSVVNSPRTIQALRDHDVTLTLHNAGNETRVIEAGTLACRLYVKEAREFRVRIRPSFASASDE